MLCHGHRSGVALATASLGARRSLTTAVAAVAVSARLVLLAAAVDAGTSASATLTFSPPVALPLTCPQSLCKYGGTTAADTFTTFPPPSASAVLGVINRTVVYSVDEGITFTPLTSADANTSLAGSAVGPGTLYPCGPSAMCSIGAATASPDGRTATGGTRSRWSVGTGSAASVSSAGAGAVGATKAHASAPRRTVDTTGTVTWDLPLPPSCRVVGYSGRVVRAGASYLKPMILIDNCTAPPKPGWGSTGHASLHVFESVDPQAPDGAWRWKSLACNGSATGGEEGANECDMEVAADGSLLLVFRVDGGDGWPDHRHKPFEFVRSRDGGATWSPPRQMPPDVLSARPQLLQLTPSGPMLLTGGRPHLMLWVSPDGGVGNTWVAYNLAGEHNARQPDPSLRYCEAFANGTSTWLESTCYNSLQRLPDDGVTGAPRALVCYDRMGTEAPVAPPECQPKEVHTFCMQVTAGKSGT